MCPLDWDEFISPSSFTYCYKNSICKRKSFAIFSIKCRFLFFCKLQYCIHFGTDIIILIRSTYYQLDKIRKILDGMLDTMNTVKPPRMTALRELREAENGSPLSILIGTILSARTRDENT